MQIIFYFDFFNELTCTRHAQSHELDYGTVLTALMNARAVP